jgi:hypothetical protein
VAVREIGENPETQESVGRKLLGRAATIVAGIALTVIALPLLFAATCLPLVPSMLRETPTMRAIAGAVLILGGITGYAISLRLKDPLQRWAIIIVTTLAIAAGGRLFLN